MTVKGRYLRDKNDERGELGQRSTYLGSHLAFNSSTTLPNSNPELGLTRNSFAPSCLALSRSPSRVDEENTTTGVRAKWGWFRIHCKTSKPETNGRFRSSNITEGSGYSLR